MYADDTQLYIHCKTSDTTDADAKLERCIAVVDKWMAASRLKMNSDKSEGSAPGALCRRMLVQLYGLEMTQSVQLIRRVYLVYWFLTTWRLTSMWRRSVASAFISCINCSRFVSRLTQNPLQHWSVPLFRAVWTTAAVCSSGHRARSQTSVSMSSMQPPVS